MFSILELFLFFLTLRSSNYFPEHHGLPSETTVPLSRVDVKDKEYRWKAWAPAWTSAGGKPVSSTCRDSVPLQCCPQTWVPGLVLAHAPSPAQRTSLCLFSDLAFPARLRSVKGTWPLPETVPPPYSGYPGPRTRAPGSRVCLQASTGLSQVCLRR